MFEGPAFADGMVVGSGDIRGVTYGNDTGLFVEFRVEQVYQEFRSNEEGYPIYNAVPFIRMYIPGDRTKVIDRAVKMEPQADMPSDPQRFPVQWNAFKTGVKAVESGFPLAEWPIMTASYVKQMNAANIYTVEGLAAVSDAALDGLGHGGRALRDQAIARVAAMVDDSALVKATAANADLQRQIDELRTSLTEKRGPGRPRKETEDAE